MLKQKISTRSLSGTTANFVRHYLNPGDDIALPWLGVPDDCAFYTYKYSNQFSYNFDVTKLIGKWAIPTFGVTNSYSTSGGKAFYNYGQTGALYAVIDITADHIASVTNIMFVRYPFPDLPGGILLSWHGAPESQTPRYKVQSDSQYVIKEHAARFVLFPIHDPNWKPSSIKWDDVYEPVGSVANGVRATKSGCDGHSVLGMAEQFTSYRLCGASMTVENTTAALYRDGAVYATNISCPYDVISACSLADRLKRYTNDFPVDVTTLTSFQPYHVFKASEGAYVVLRHAGDSFDFKNVRQYKDFANVSSRFDDMDWFYTFGPTYEGEELEQSQWVSSGFLNVTNDRFDYIYYVGGPASGSISQKIDHYWLLDTIEPINWTTGVVIPTPSDWSRATFTLKFNTYVECTCGTKSVFKPSITRSAPYDGEAFRVIRDFYLDHDGIYPASWNSNGKLNNIINRLKSTGTVSYLYTPRPGPTRKQIADRKAVFDRLRKLQGYGVDNNLTSEDEQFIKDAIANHYIQSWEKYLASFKQNPPKEKKKPAGRKPNKQQKQAK